MDEKYSFIISEDLKGQRLDSVLSSLLEEVSRSYIQKLIEAGKVSIDGAVCLSKKEKLEQGQNVELLLPPPAPLDAQPQDIPLDIVYEDSDLIVVNKPKGMVVHPAAGNLDGTLVNALLFHCGSMSVINGVERPGIVHRIDKDTSGLLVCAKSDAAHRGLAEQFAVHSITRLYQGICYGSLKDTEFTVKGNIGRDLNNRLRMAIVSQGGKPAVTHIKLLQNFNGFAHFQAQLETGRTHQIRVHMQSKGHPLLGDSVYGPGKHPFGVEGQMLHAGVLGFNHPITGQYMEFSIPAPAEFANILEKLKTLN